MLIHYRRATENDLATLAEMRWDLRTEEDGFQTHNEIMEYDLRGEL